NVSRKEQELENLRQNLGRQNEVLEKKKQEIEEVKNQHVRQLEKISGISVDEAKAQLVEALKDEAKTQAMASIKDIVEEARLTASKEAKKIVIQTIQRTATESAIENTVSVFNIENDEIK